MYVATYVYIDSTEERYDSTGFVNAITDVITSSRFL